MSVKKAPVPPKIQKNQYMQVFVRCRPLNDTELSQRNACAVDIQGQKDIAIQDRCNSKITKTYSFDKTFGSSTPQAEVYQSVVEPLIADVLSGFNCTVFAYGQTGSGKTFTMEGDLGTGAVISQDSEAGLIPRAVCALFDELRVLQAEYTVRISFMELYNEELYDLLSSDDVPPKLRLYDDVTKKGSVIVQHLQEVMVHTQSQVLNELRKGSAKRQVAATLMNAQSSRSHTIFTVTVHSKENSVHGEELLKTGKLNLVDLAGSENIGRSGSANTRAREAASINQSLLTLSRVTACLVEHQPHVPYRESKLTRLLQDSLGGRTKTALIATISPAVSNTEETLSTLDYAHRAKSVANRPEVNQKIAQNVIMKEYKDVIDDLKKKLELHRNGSGIYVNSENYHDVLRQIGERNQEISELISKVRAIGLVKKNLEETYHAFTKSMEENKLNLENVKSTIVTTNEDINVATDTLSKVKSDQAESKSLLETLANKENTLLSQAEQLTNIVESTQADSNKVHDRLEYSRVVLVENQVVLKRILEKSKFHKQAIRKMMSFFSESGEILTKLLFATENLDVESKSSLDTFCESVKAHLVKQYSKLEEARVHFHQLNKLGNQSASKTVSGLTSVQLEVEKNLRAVVEILQSTCASYDNLVSSLPSHRSALINFVNESVQNLKQVTQEQITDAKVSFDYIQSKSDSNIDVVVDSLNSLLLLEKVPQNTVINHVESMKETTKQVAEICLKLREDFASQKNDLLSWKVEEVKQTTTIMEQIAASVGYIEQLQIHDVSNLCRAVNDEFRSMNGSFLSGVKNLTHPIKTCGTESLEIRERAAVKVNELLSHDYQLPIENVLKENKNNRSESLITLKSGAAAIMELAHETTSKRATLSSKLEELKENNNRYGQNQDESLKKLHDGIESTSSEVLDILETGKATVNHIVATEMTRDVPTGETPSRKSYGTIPKHSPLSSPILQKIKPRIQKASWKQLLKSPRKPFLSTTSLQDNDEDCMASDSEMTVNKKMAFELHGLQKSSSLSDLRSNAVFHRPRIPKKTVRKAL